MIIGTVQKQVSTWLINVKVMYQFQNPLKIMSFDKELSIYFFKSLQYNIRVNSLSDMYILFTVK